jgi:putative addiction module killer protein
MKKETIIYQAENGKEPLTIWIEEIKESSFRARIRTRFVRVLEGNLGDHKYLRDEISELRFDFGKGYRVYYSELDNIIILLLCGGDKSNQSRDIKKAVEFLKDYKERFL